MDALQKAKDAIEGINLGDQSLGEAEFTAIYAQACAAIAQAEAAQRQAAAMERIAAALYVEGINKEPRSVAAILSSMEWAQA